MVQTLSDIFSEEVLVFGKDAREVQTGTESVNSPDHSMQRISI
jgi:hypothetical protein